MNWTCTLENMEDLLENWGRFMRDWDPKVGYPDKASPFEFIQGEGDEVESSREWLGWGTDKDGAGNDEGGYDWISAGVLDNWLRKMREDQERHFDVLRRWYYHRHRRHITEQELGAAQRALLDIYRPGESPKSSPRTKLYIAWGEEEAA